MCILKQFVDNPCGVGIEWGGVITSSPPRAMRERVLPAWCLRRGWLLWWIGGAALLGLLLW